MYKSAPVKEKSKNNARESSASEVLPLPLEIREIIMDMVFGLAIGPRIVYSHLESPILKYFLALDKTLYTKYAHIYWSQNTWIVGPGPLTASMRFMNLLPNPNIVINATNTTGPAKIVPATDFSLQNPNPSALRIRHMQLAFTLSDLPSPPINRTQPSSSTQTSHDTLKNALLKLWRDKFERAAALDSLDTLTLDFTKAYTCDLIFVGLDAVQQFMPFLGLMPRRLEVKAPRKDLEEEIKSALERLNRVDSTSDGG